MNWPALLLVATAPTAIVDTVYGVPGLAPLTLLDPGTELVVGAGRVRLAYFESCVHETIRGGRLRIGITASVADDAVVERDGVLDKDGELVALYPATIGSENNPAPDGETKIAAYQELRGLLNADEKGILVSLGKFTSGALAVERGERPTVAL